jgi:hypothetical protein
MSLCYDGEKWLMVTLASIAISLTVGLVLIQYAYGQLNNDTNQTNDTKGTIKVEGTAKKDNNEDYRVYGTFEMSDNNKVCPSNQCKLIPKYDGCTSYDDTSAFLSLGERAMTLECVI